MNLQQTQVPAFDWPTYKKDSDRIKALTIKYKDKPLSEAFSDYYGIKLSESSKKTVDNVQLIDSLPVGTILKTVVSQTKEGIIYFPDLFSCKEIVCKHNPLQIASLINTTTDAEIIQTDDKKIKIDLIKPIREKWINEVLRAPHKHVLTVTDLKLTKGGFIGTIEIQELSRILNTKWEEQVYIPGSQIELNIATDFEKWKEKTVQAFLIANLTNSTDPNKPALILSVKKYLQHLGSNNLVGLYNMYCEDSTEWADTTATEYDGVVTGILNSKTTKGVFIEIPSLYITGLYKCDYKKMVQYKPGQSVKVNITEFAPLTRYDKIINQTVHIIPYEIKDGAVVKNKLNVYLQIID